GQGRRRRPVGHATGRRSDAGPGRDDEPDLRHAEGGFRKRGRGAAGAAARHRCWKPQHDATKAKRKNLMSYLSHLKVMIVDDMQTSRLLIRSALEELGVTQVAIASDGEQALKAMMVQPLPLVISDYNMPKLDGLSLLRALRAYGPTSK